MANKGKPTYAGKISHAGGQKVDALFPNNAPTGKMRIKEGDDLRIGKGKK